MHPSPHVAFIFVTLFFVAVVVLLMYNDDYWSRKILKAPWLYDNRGGHHHWPQARENKKDGGTFAPTKRPSSFAPATSATPSGTPSGTPTGTPSGSTLTPGPATTAAITVTPLPTPNPPQDTTLTPPPTAGITSSTMSAWK